MSVKSMLYLYGIANCATVKKARAWLEEDEVAYEFVDFKKSPPDQALIERWLHDVHLDQLVNRKGTTWRKLTEEQRASADDRDAAIRLMIENPSLIKRPVLDSGERCIVGFQEEVFESFVAAMEE